MPRRIATAVACAMFLLAGGRAAALAQTPPADVFDRVKHGYATSEGGVLSGTWDWVEKDLTLVTIPGASHFVQQDAADLVSSTLRWRLAARTR